MSLTTTTSDIILPPETAEYMQPTAIEAMQRAEIDVQISTAHRFPRSMQQFKSRAIGMATMDEDVAASCLYSRPVGGGKFAEGLSVRMAEIVGASYGNLRVAAIIVEQTERYVKARGIAHDLESNFCSACEVIESTVKRDGTPYDERMRIVIAKACLAKARRDATFQVVPKALCKPVEAAAKAVAIGNAATIEQRRTAVLGWIGKLGIDTARVYQALGIKGEADLGLEELAQLTGLKTAIKDGDVTVDEAFPNNVVRKVESPKPISRPPAPTPQPEPQSAHPTANAGETAPGNLSEEKSPRDKIRGLLNLTRFNESDLIKWAYEAKLVTKKDVTTLDGVNDGRMDRLLETWDDVVKAMKEFYPVAEKGEEEK